MAGRITRRCAGCQYAVWKSRLTPKAQRAAGRFFPYCWWDSKRRIARGQTCRYTLRQLARKRADLHRSEKEMCGPLWGGD